MFFLPIWDRTSDSKYNPSSMWDETDPQYSLETQDQIKKTKTSSCRLLRCIIVLSDVKWAIYQLRSYHGALSTFPLTVMASFTERCGIRLDSLSRSKRTKCVANENSPRMQSTTTGWTNLRTSYGVLQLNIRYLKCWKRRRFHFSWDWKRKLPVSSWRFNIIEGSEQRAAINC